jgi:hypothetical protein
MRRLAWTPPKDPTVQRATSFATYKNQNRVLGDASAEDVRSMTETLTNGPSPPPPPPYSSPTRLGRFFGRGGNRAQRQQHESSNINPEAVDAVSEKAANQHWYSALLRIAPSSRSGKTEKVTESRVNSNVANLPELDGKGRYISELPTTTPIYEMPAQDLVELPTASATSYNWPESGLSTYERKGKQPAKQNSPGGLGNATASSSAQDVQITIPRIIRRPPTDDDAEYVLKSRHFHNKQASHFLRPDEENEPKMRAISYPRDEWRPEWEEEED